MHTHIVHWMAAIVFEHDGKQLIKYGHTHDISLSGATIYTEEVLHENEHLTLEIRIPRGKSINEWVVIEIRCRNGMSVAEEDHFRNQVQFLAFTGDGKQVLENALRERGASMEVRQQ